jgi:hypothetical protein
LKNRVKKGPYPNFGKFKRLIVAKEMLRIMFAGEEEKWARFRVLTEIMEKVPRQEPPEGFTARVMARLPEGKGTVRRFSFLRPFWTPAFATYLTRGLQLPVMKTECAFYFFLTGFFYLVLGFVLFLGMRDFSGDVAGSSWLRVQPFIGFFLALWFFAFSILLRGRRPAGLKAARITVFIYLEIILVNGALPLIKFGSQWYLLPFWGVDRRLYDHRRLSGPGAAKQLQWGSVKIATVKGWGA